MIKIICLGKIKESYLEELIRDYMNRILKYHKIEMIELKDVNDLESEADDILKHVEKKDYLIACALDGEKLDSVSFAKKIDKTFINYSTIDFVIGSSLGLSNRVKSRADYKLSFSDMTFPRGLFRGILLEQIYRAFKINNNENYHK